MNTPGSISEHSYTLKVYMTAGVDPDEAHGSLLRTLHAWSCDADVTFALRLADRAGVTIEQLAVGLVKDLPAETTSSMIIRTIKSLQAEARRLGFDALGLYEAKRAVDAALAAREDEK